MAQSNIKAIRKINDITISENKATIDSLSFYIKVSMAKDTFANIENFTSSFLKIIKTSSCTKADFIGKRMDFLIPSCYIK
jgi:hypothetical protein